MNQDQKIEALEQRILKLEALIQKSTEIKRGNRIKKNYYPSNKVKLWCKTDFPLVSFNTELNQFIDYWMSRSGAGAIKINWDLTFRNWIRNSAYKYRSRHETYKRTNLDFTEAVRTSFD